MHVGPLNLPYLNRLCPEPFESVVESQAAVRGDASKALALLAADAEVEL